MMDYGRALKLSLRARLKRDSFTMAGVRRWKVDGSVVDPQFLRDAGIIPSAKDISNFEEWRNHLEEVKEDWKKSQARKALVGVKR